MTDSALQVPDLPARPVSPIKPGSALDFEEPPHLLREKLFTAELRIAELEGKLAKTPARYPEDQQDQLRLIEDLRKRNAELELVCEAQATDPLPKVREDVEREWAGRVETLQQKLSQREAFIAELTRECDDLRKAKSALWKLAHGKTSDMLTSIQSPVNSPRPPVSPTRPASVLGTMRINQDPPGSPSPLRKVVGEKLRNQKRSKFMADELGEAESSAPHDDPTAGRYLLRKRSRPSPLLEDLQVAELDIPKRRRGGGKPGNVGKRSVSGGSRKSSRLFLDESMRDIQAEIAAAEKGQNFSFG